jgi:hypothetical protein
LVISVLKDASGRQPIPPRALIRRESFSVNVLRDFENGSTLVTAENNRSQERAQIEGPIADEAAIIGQAVVQIAGFQEPPPAHEVQDWDFSL